MIEKNGINYLVREQKKPNSPATYKQYKYLTTFENVKMTINVSQFIKYVIMSEASEAIEAAIEGKQIVVE